jgi:hypothetical protein
MPEVCVVIFTIKYINASKRGIAKPQLTYTLLKNQRFAGAKTKTADAIDADVYFNALSADKSKANLNTIIHESNPMQMLSSLKGIGPGEI